MWLYRKLKELFAIRAMAEEMPSLTVTMLKAFGYSAIYFFFMSMLIYFIAVPLVKEGKKGYAKGGWKTCLKYIWRGITSFFATLLLLIIGAAQKFWNWLKKIATLLVQDMNMYPRLRAAINTIIILAFALLAFWGGCCLIGSSAYTQWIFYPAPKQVEIMNYVPEYVEVPMVCPECGYDPNAPVPLFEPQIKLTDEDRAMAEAIVCGEAGNQSFLGKKLVAQCLWDAMMTDNLSSIAEVRRAFGYEGYLPLSSWSGATEAQKEEVREAVRAIFDREEFPVEENILYFYSTTRGVRPKSWHETQKFVVWEGDHRFFARWD